MKVFKLLLLNAWLSIAMLFIIALIWFLWKRENPFKTFADIAYEISGPYHTSKPKILKIFSVLFPILGVSIFIGITCYFKF
jgi:uncharacterized iron-regulated membrane protein